MTVQNRVSEQVHTYCMTVQNRVSEGTEGAGMRNAFS